MSGDYAPSTYEWVREQVELYERTDGRDGATVDGRPIIILRTTGARSGAIRKSPVMRFERDGVYVAVASVGGQPRNPAWYHNLLADPRGQVQDGAEVHDVVAREAVGDERRAWWDTAVAAWAHYAELQTRTDRLFPILLLEPL